MPVIWDILYMYLQHSATQVGRHKRHPDANHTIDQDWKRHTGSVKTLKKFGGYGILIHWGLMIQPQ